MSHNDLGVALKDAGDLDGAIACYKKALALDPKHDLAHNNLGNALEAQGKLPEATAWYRKALAINPNYVTALRNLGRVLCLQRAYADAVPHFARLKQLQPHVADYWAHEAWAHLAAGNAEAYRRACAAMVERFGNTKDPRALTLLLLVGVAAPGAVADPAALVRLAESAGSPRFLGAALYRAGRYEPAARHLEEAAKAGKLRVGEWYVLGMAYHRLGQGEQARKCLDICTRSIDAVKRQEAEGKPSPWTWIDWVEAEHLRREAEALLKEAPAAPEGTKG